MLEAVQLTRRFDAHVALDALTLKVDAGQVYCLLGPNGAGKTTTMNLFLGVLKPSSGDARVDGVSVASSPAEARSRLAFIPDQVALYPELSGLENLAFFQSLGGTKPNGSLEAALDSVGLAREAHHRPASTYSKGMRQKVGIAIARARGTKTLLLDEPTTGLDPQASNDFSVLLKRLKDEGVAILMATHDLFRAQDVATHVGIIRGGKLLSDFSVASLSAGELEQRYLEAVKV